MRDIYIDPPSDFPRVYIWDYLVSGDNPTPLISLRGWDHHHWANQAFFLPGII